MCHFVTLVVPTEDGDAVRAVMKLHGRAAKPIDNPSIRKVLREGEHQYLTTVGHCDCGTVLAARPDDTVEDFEEQLAGEAARLKRKGWSEAKIGRAVDDRRKAEDRRQADARPERRVADSLELWNAVLSDLGDKLKLAYAGLFVRSYSGAIGSEEFRASRRQVPKRSPWQNELASIQPNEVTIFPLN